MKQDLTKEGVAIINVPDPNREGGYRIVDIGDFYSGNYLITTPELYEKYGDIMEKRYPDKMIGYRK